ncbi:gamma-glutamylcyclotransferase family protein [Roseibium sp. RKSG952]|uniref:gamma-glutamylcyclotransferase family protein n=1 Tax=Roseibium sp. RKSG952 TaxID=2529384 RepID=UPI0018AD12D8|nr:gamma-glutamylcyclotransferase family protein [Roseibium sp. RKSG952]
MNKTVLTVITLVIGFSGSAFADTCRPAVDPNRPQMVIGYGSLMQTASKQRTAPNTTANRPVLVTGYQRSWNAKGSPVGYSTTYLGVKAVEGARMNAAIYEYLNTDEIAATDQREGAYCRRSVPLDQVTMLDGGNLAEDAQIWIYETKPQSTAFPSEKWPIVQSYVDIFISGCLELEQAVVTDDLGDMSFSEACVAMTSDWSPDWINDRIHPRRPFAQQPNAGRIDRLLHAQIPAQFNAIRLEK